MFFFSFLLAGSSRAEHAPLRGGSWAGGYHHIKIAPALRNCPTGKSGVNEMN